MIYEIKSENIYLVHGYFLFGQVLQFSACGKCERFCVFACGWRVCSATCDVLFVDATRVPDMSVSWILLRRPPA